MRLIFISLFFLLSANSFGQDLDEIIETYFRNVGGKENIRQLQTASKVYCHYNLFGKIDTVQTSATEKIPFYQVNRSYSISGNLKSISYFNEKGGKLANYVPYPSEIDFPGKQNVSLDRSSVVLMHFDKKKLKYAGKDTINGVLCFVVKTNYKDPAIHNLMFYFDAQSGLLSAERSEDFKDRVDLYKDYRMTGGVMFPFLQEGYLNGTPITRTVFEKVKFNISVDPKEFDFTKPEATPQRIKQSKFNKIEYVDSKLGDSPLSDLISNFKGKRILIDIWATWCGPCKYEFAKYDDALYAFLEEKKVEMVFLSIDKAEKKNQWEKDLTWFNLNGYHLMANKKLYSSIKDEIVGDKTFFIPRYILIDENGKVVSGDLGKPSTDAFRKKIGELLK